MSMAAGARRAVAAIRTKAPSASRSMSGHGSYEQELAEMEKWRKVTWVVAPGSLLLSAYMVLTSKHPEHTERIPYSYLHVRNKQFPWGPDGLFESKHEAKHAHH